VASAAVGLVFVLFKAVLGKRLEAAPEPAAA
jgi:hypothetical protein